MKYSLPTLIILISLFLFIQIIGLAVNSVYMTSRLPYGMQPLKMNGSAAPLFFIGAILAVSVLFLIMKKFKFERIMKAWFFLAFISCVAITLSAFINPFVAILIALLIGGIKFKNKSNYIHNFGEILVYGGAVALFAPALTFWTSVLLLGIISIYDYLAVFVTKHMVQLANIQKNLEIFSGLIVAYKGEYALLGGGDIAFTLIFATVVLKQFGVVPALFSIYGATTAIILLAIIGKRKKYYPAMPFITAGSLSGFLASLI